MKNSNNRKKHGKMPPWLVTVLYFAVIAALLGGAYGIYRLTAKEPVKPVSAVTKALGDKYDGDGYLVDENGEKIKDDEGGYQNILVEWANEYLGAEADADDFGVDEGGYCYRPSTGERYKSAAGKEFTWNEARDAFINGENAAQLIKSGEDAFDTDGYVLDDNGERVKDADGNYQNILASWASEFLGAEVDVNDFGVDESGYCYRPSTGERYKSADGREFTADDAYNGGFDD